jgi:molybdopterin-guanine dinucleotide biosynthesis protein A
MRKVKLPNLDALTGIILSGGKNSRMGRNKSFLKVGKNTIIERLRDLMLNLFSEVIIITNEPDDYSFLELPIYKDVYTYRGPLAGIHSGLLHSTNENNFIISCDLPFITADLIKYLVYYKTKKLITVAKSDGFIQQLTGRYSKACLLHVEEILNEQVHAAGKDKKHKNRNYSVFTLFNRVGAEIVSLESEPFYSKDLFFNMNNSDDYEYVLKKLKNNDLL